jgi:hypothetical protein
VKGTLDAVFDWHYELKRSKLLDLYEKGKANSWNATDLAWDTEVDIEKMMSQRQLMGGGGMINKLLAPPRPLDDREAFMLNLSMNASMLSQFLHGEQGALLATAKIVEVYHRYLTDKLGVSYEIHPSLATLFADIMSDSRWDVTYLGMQIMVEGLALAAFGLQKMMMAEEPLIVDITTRIMADESRHVAFGVLSLEEVTRSYTASELREREDFLMEATHLLRFENTKDSVEDPDVMPPQELVQLLMQFLANRPQDPAAAAS